MSSAPSLILVPGAWMGAWIWEPTVDRLRARGLRASTLSLAGLDKQDADHASDVRLEDHVRQVSQVVAEASGDVVLVSHSYSAVVTGQVADQLPDRIAGMVHIGGFLPTDGRSLLDDWGSSPSEREQEARDIRAAGNLWIPPTRSMLEMEPDLSGPDRELLVTRCRPHPGSTITDQARMNAPASHQPTTYVALSTVGKQAAWRAAPAMARSASRWRKRVIASGHWPMLSRLDEVVSLLAEEGHWYMRSAAAEREGDTASPSVMGRWGSRGA